MCVSTACVFVPACLCAGTEATLVVHRYTVTKPKAKARLSSANTSGGHPAGDQRGISTMHNLRWTFLSLSAFKCGCVSVCVCLCLSVSVCHCVSYPKQR